MQFASVLFFICSFAAPVVHLYAALFPVTHHVPLNGFIWTKNLTGAEAGVTPKLRNLVEAWENASGNAVTFPITSAYQQDSPGWLKMFHQSANTPEAIARHQALLGKHIS